VSSNRTLWEEGRQPGRRVALGASVMSLAVVIVSLGATGEIGLWFDIAFVLLCVAAALAVRPDDFFVAGVLPPLLMAGTITLLAIVDRPSVADPRDGIVQAVVSGLAHHATALVVGYALALGLLAVRQVALRNSGRLRRTQAPPPVGAARRPS
jgi:hypothetical protein